MITRINNTIVPLHPIPWDLCHICDLPFLEPGCCCVPPQSSCIPWLLSAGSMPLLNPKSSGLGHQSVAQRLKLCRPSPMAVSNYLEFPWLHCYCNGCSQTLAPLPLRDYPCPRPSASVAVCVQTHHNWLPCRTSHHRGEENRSSSRVYC
jgi:hypothetical protein